MAERPTRVLGVLDGADLPLERLAAWAQAADVVLAADGAAERLRALGRMPDVVIGDLDSLSDPGRFSTVAHDPDQETSDADKLLVWAARVGYTEITLAGVEGDRLDHVLATLSSVARCPLRVRFVLRSGMGYLVSSERPVAVLAEASDLISLIPLEACTAVVLDGVRWPLRHDVLSPSTRVSLSNRAAGGLVSASVATGAAMLIHIPDEPWEPW